MNRKEESTPILNIIHSDKDLYEKYYQDKLADLKFKIDNPTHILSTLKAIPRIKAKFGKQNRTWIGSSEIRRFYIWEGPNWRIYVHNVGGVSFEVKEGISPEQAYDAWTDFRTKYYK